MAFRAGVAFLLAALAPVSSDAQPGVPSLRDFLLGRGGFTGEDLRALESGEAVAKLRPERVDSETRLLGVVKIAGRPETFIERYRDIVEFESGAGVPEIGTFSEPPRVEDLEGLTFDDGDVEDARSCRPGKCDIKMSESMMAAFRSIDWARPGARERAQALARRMIVDFLESYQRGGNDALGELHDKKRPFPCGSSSPRCSRTRTCPSCSRASSSFSSIIPASRYPGRRISSTGPRWSLA